MYFAFHKEMLIRLFELHGFGFGDPSELINSAARNWYDLDGDSVIIRPEAFNATADRFSAVIILVAQQVLVVEEMARDHNGFSEDAYFPRLRRAMNSELPERSNHPFSTSEEFEEIWRKFRSEILLAGGTNKSVTFFSGKYANRNKSYPLSQALLTQEDVFKLIRMIGPGRIFNLNQSQLSMEIQNFKTRLSRRGQKTIGTPFLIDRVFQQIRSFKGYSIPDEHQAFLSQDSRLNFALRIYKDHIDFGQEEYRLGFFDENGTRVLSDAEHRTQFRILLNSRKFMFFAESQLGDSWETSQSSRDLSKGQSLIVLATDEGKAAAVSILRRIFPELNVDTWIPLQTFGRISLWAIDALPEPSSVFRIKDGKVQELNERNTAPAIHWVGGVCVSEKENRFLVHFLPDKYTIANIPYLMLGPVKVNGRLTTFELFLDSLHSIETEQKFEFELITGARGYLSIALPSRQASVKRGFPITKNGKIFPIVSELPLGADSLQGFSADPVGAWRYLSIAALVEFVKFKENNLVLINSSKLDIIVDVIERTPISLQLKSILIQRMKSSMTAPQTVLAELGF